MPRLLGTPLAADLEATAGACHAVMPGGRVLLGCGFWDNSIRHVFILLRGMLDCIRSGPGQRRIRATG